MIKKLANVMTLMITLLALAGCGSGGGEDSGYTGKTSPAALTTVNAYDMSLDVMAGVHSYSGLGALAKTVDGSSTPRSTIDMRSLSDILERSISKMIDKPALAKTAAAAVTARNSGYSGTYDYTGSLDSSTGKFAATFTFNTYQEEAGSVVMSGSISVTGTLSIERGGIDRLTIIIPGLKISSADSDYGVLSTLKGQMDLVRNIDKTLTFSIVYTDGATGQTYWYKDFCIVDSGLTTVISGSFYHPVHGYVTVTTLTPMSDIVTVFGDPLSGQVLFSGSNGSKVRLTYVEGGHVVEVDPDGSGLYIYPM